jgi:hypothetical protein
MCVCVYLCVCVCVCVCVCLCVYTTWGEQWEAEDEREHVMRARWDTEHLWQLTKAQQQALKEQLAKLRYSTGV